jgi:ZIP family zinc transporter
MFYMGTIDPYLLTALGLFFIFFMTTSGAALVFFFKNKVGTNFNKLFLGFASGVMLAATVWSLILPAVNETANLDLPIWLPVTVGIIVGGLFLFGMDNLIPHLHPDAKKPEGLHTKLKKTTLLYLAVALHNIPEGLAVGLAFGMAINQGSPTLMSAAIGLAIGIGIQNFPEGTAVTLPLKEEGASNKKAFMYGMFSGLVEPVFGLVGLFLALELSTIMPWFLAFAAGAMIYVIVEELIPEAHLGEHSHLGTFGVMSGFVIMMALSLILG